MEPEPIPTDVQYRDILFNDREILSVLLDRLYIYVLLEMILISPLAIMNTIMQG